MKYSINCHSSIKIDDGIVVYFDPIEIKAPILDADIIFITHTHYDHYSVESIRNITKTSTIIVGNFEGADVVVKPNKEYSVMGLNFKTVFSYNNNKPFHKKGDHNVGYVVNFPSNIVYVAGDTDNIKCLEKIKCDIAFVPVGGHYTMDYEEASNLINKIKPKIAIPTHYGSIVGEKDLGAKFSKLILPPTEVEILI